MPNVEAEVASVSRDVNQVCSKVVASSYNSRPRWNRLGKRREAGERIGEGDILSLTDKKVLVTTLILQIIANTQFHKTISISMER